MTVRDCGPGAILSGRGRGLVAALIPAATATTTSLRGRTTKPAGGRFENLFFGSSLDFVQNSDDGTFAFGPLGRGVIRIAPEPAGASRLDTDWFHI